MKEIIFHIYNSVNIGSNKNSSPALFGNKKFYLRWLLPVLLFSIQQLFAQTDSSFLKKYPYLIGNIAFSTDSLVTDLGSLRQGTDTTFKIELYNAGNMAVNLIPGKSNKFVNIDYSVQTLPPQSEAVARITIHAPVELSPDTMRFEAAFQTDDRKNPFKFLYFNILIKKAGLTAESYTLDTVPKMIFDNYLYDFGHLRKGRTLYYTFHFVNRGEKPLVIHEITVEKGLTITGLPLKVTPAGGQNNLTVKIKARHYVGVLHKSIRIVSNDPVNPVIILGIHGTVKEIPAMKNPTDYCIDN